MVHNDRKGPPTKKHYTYDEAIAEAERLAEKHPGQFFFVLETVNCFAAIAPARRVPLFDEDEIPF